MIAASEPLEFVPHGRNELAKHPGQIYNKNNNSSLSENSLLYKLTNFAIKDESLLEIKSDEDHEWWCVREVCCDDSREQENDFPQTPKEAKEEYLSETFHPQSKLKNEFNISVKSELISSLKKIETENSSATAQYRGASANSSGNLSKKFNLNNSRSAMPGKNQINPKTACCYEEELYVKGCTVIWSKGLVSAPESKISNSQHRTTLSCYTLENPVKHAIFCNFHVNINNTMLIDALNSQIGDVKKNIKIEDTIEHMGSETMPSIVVLDKQSTMRVFSADGRDYINSIPFQVKNIWPMKYGVLLEKGPAPLMHNSMLLMSFTKLNESNNSAFSKLKNPPVNISEKLRTESVSGFDQDIVLPTCFSLGHPLDEVIPILMKSPSHGLQYYNDGDLQIVFVSSNPSILLVYDWKVGTHSLWKVRKALRDECLAMVPTMNSTTSLFSQSYDLIGSPMHSNTRNITAATGSPFHSNKGSGTPKTRINSPLAQIFHQQGLSPHTSLGQAFSASMVANTIPQSPPSLPLYPEICLDHIWTDTQIIRRDPIDNPKDTKTFLHTDLVGHDYLCFIIKVENVSRLQMLRLQKSHSHGQLYKRNLVVGSVSTVLAKDAVALKNLNMIALIDQAGNIMLHSGTSVVGKIHVGGVLARLIDSPYMKRATFQSPFPRRSSLLPSRCHETTFDDSALHLLSPVPHTSVTRIEHKETLGLSGLCDPVGSRITLQFDSGIMYRISLPEVTGSNLVTKCCAALKEILPSDVTMQVLIKWYGVRNAPGNQNLTMAQEWSVFSDLMFGLIGYDTHRLSDNKHNDEQDSAEVATKKQRTSNEDSSEYWEYLLATKLHKEVGGTLCNILKIKNPDSEAKLHRHGSSQNESGDYVSQFNVDSLLFPFALQVLFAYHLIYEEIKLNMLLYNDLKPLSKFLYQLAKDLRLKHYVKHYWLDFPVDVNLEFVESESQISELMLKKLTPPSYFTEEPPHIFEYLDAMLKNIDVGYYPYLCNVNDTSKDLIEVLTLADCGRSAGVHIVSNRDTVTASSTPRCRVKDSSQYASPYCRAVISLCEKGITPRDIEQLPPALSLFLISICSRCKSNPPAGWSAEAYTLVMRHDLALHAVDTSSQVTAYMESVALGVQDKETAYSLVTCSAIEHTAQNKTNEEIHTGMEHLYTRLFNLLYPNDHRMAEVFSLLQSSVPVTINLYQRSDVSDHDFIEEQEKQLFAMSTRTMALPVARGMLTYRSLPCAPTEPLTLPKLCLTGRGPPPRYTTINLPSNESTPSSMLWPLFHNGVATGLSLVPMTGLNIDSSWIIYNKPKGASEMTAEHAGLLMALGLNGHLKDMPFMQIYDYLVKCHEMSSVGLLLGLAANYKGTMDVQATKMMGIHLEPLLPATSIELDIRQNIAVAALLGVGIVYQETNHTHYTQVLLNEIGKPPGPEMENCADREGYALAAGLGLGFVCVGGGQQVPKFVSQRLRTFMLGGEKLPLYGSQKEKYKLGSFAVREGQTVNLDITAPGATLALGLMYFRTNNEKVAEWLRPPDTAYLLDFVRPDLLILRIIARGLILWDSIEPSEEWIENQVPESFKPYCFVKPTEDSVDYEAMNQAYCNIVAGACFALGLRFAGSGNEEARDVALHYVRVFLAVTDKSIAELAGRSTLETCLCVSLLAAGMIMAGRGDLEVLRLCRRMRARVSTRTSHSNSHTLTLTHGGQMAVHCALGLLFLGGGRATLSTTPTAIAALVAAFFPKFPTHSEDNRYHLQAFRHLYVLAVEPRLILPRDIETGKLCYANIQVIDLKGAVKEMKAPCIVPDLNSLRELRIYDPRYWPITFQRDRNWDQLKKFLEYTWCIDIKQRVGCLSYLDDPNGFLSILGQTLTLDKANTWSVTPENIGLFTNDDKIRNFVKHYLMNNINFSSNIRKICGDCLISERRQVGDDGGDGSLPTECSCRKYTKDEQEYVQSLSMLTYECVVKDILCALPIWTTFFKIIKTIKDSPNSYNMWQIKLLFSQIDNYNQRAVTEMKIDCEEIQSEPLISTEFTLAIKQRVSAVVDRWEDKILPFLKRYLGMISSSKLDMCQDDIKRILAAFIVYHDLPRNILSNVKSDNELEIMLELDNLNLSAEALMKVEALLL